MNILLRRCQWIPEPEACQSHGPGGPKKGSLKIQVVFMSSKFSGHLCAKKKCLHARVTFTRNNVKVEQKYQKNLKNASIRIGVFFSFFVTYKVRMEFHAPAGNKQNPFCFSVILPENTLRVSVTYERRIISNDAMRSY